MSPQSQSVSATGSISQVNTTSNPDQNSFTYKTQTHRQTDRHWWSLERSTGLGSTQTNNNCNCGGDSMEAGCKNELLTGSSSMSLDEVDQSVGWWVVWSDRRVSLEVAVYHLRQLLTKLHSVIHTPSNMSRLIVTIHQNTSNYSYIFDVLVSIRDLHQRKKLVLGLLVLDTTRTCTWHAKNPVVCVTELIAPFVTIHRLWLTLVRRRKKKNWFIWCCSISWIMHNRNDTKNTISLSPF